jgi:hypothetical protein
MRAIHACALKEAASCSLLLSGLFRGPRLYVPDFAALFNSAVKSWLLGTSPRMTRRWGVCQTGSHRPHPEEPRSGVSKDGNGAQTPATIVRFVITVPAQCGKEQY